MAEHPLFSAIHAQQQRLEGIKTLLVKERQALLERDSVNIESLLREKLRLIDELKQVDGEIAEHPDLAQLKQLPEFLQLVEHCKSTLAQCQRDNVENHRLADQTLASMGRLQQILHRTKSLNSMTYTQDGGTTAGARLGRTIKA
ncbi:flagellar protein FlgN [Ferrimonas aestuarii]|uniref:Flagellar protein FlgN n=1 Tax=Ferrimonas aestuarii TaxID=2569539 RepID=A0A4U1BSU2_9GAMM|nr:flagellar protein FlgN [Ferrimonas aestuarii]TKB58209.1 flagellar protein FlgN [Ferrimonas aestuarii]